MKKILPFLCLVTFYYSANAQIDSCRASFRINESELTETKTFYSKYILKDKRIAVWKIISPSGSGIYLSFLCNASFLDVDRKGVFLKFKDGTILKFPETKIDVEVANVNEYKYTALLRLPDELYSKIVEVKLAKGNFLTGDFDIDEAAADELVKYLKCAKSFK